jgi:hypothetical protein
MVFSTTFNTISVISWWLILLVEEVKGKVMCSCELYYKSYVHVSGIVMSLCERYDLIWFDLIWFLVFNATFSSISAISWWPVLLVFMQHCSKYSEHINILSWWFLFSWFCTQ